MTATGTPTAAPAARPPRRLKPPIRRNARNVIFFLALGVAVVVAAVTTTVVLVINQSAYQAGHQPSPSAATDAYLYAMLQDHDESSASKYLCSSGNARRITHQMIESITAYTGQADGNSISYLWTIRTVARPSSGAATVTVTVDTRLTSSSGTLQQPGQTWTLRLRNESGWKVCTIAIPH